jgi:hypothetical protein
MFVRLEFFGAGENADQALGLVDEDGKVLRADPEGLVLVREGKEWDFVAGGLAHQAAGGGIGHGDYLD